MPRLTEYLLKLSTDAHELEKYRAIRDGHRGPTELGEYLTQTPGPGLSLEQAEAVLSLDSRRVLEAVIEELATESSSPEHPFYGIGITFSCELNRVQTRIPPRP